MKFVDYLVRVLVVLAFIVLLVSPEKWGFIFLLLSFFAVGLWTLLYPKGVLGWVKNAHPEIDIDDPSVWWIPRVIGVGFLVIVLFAVVNMAFARR